MKTTAASILIMLSLVCDALIPKAQAQEEFSRGSTAGGHGALESLTTGTDNTALGAGALHDTTKGGANTAIGAKALRNNTVGDNNTASGLVALLHNTTGSSNVADGAGALYGNESGDQNTAVGLLALKDLTSGNNNTALGFNSGLGVTGNRNTAVGAITLSGATGNNNTALGFDSGNNLTTGSDNIDVGNLGVAGESNTIRIGSASQVRTFIAGISGARVTGAIVQVTAGGQLGAAPSSARFKEEIKPMDKASEAILALKPVTFRYKKEVDAERAQQFGLVAEDVEKVNSDLVMRDADGKPYTVRYDQVNAMLLNEFLKEHWKVQQLEKQVEALTAGLQKVSAQLELSKPAPETVLNNQ